MNIFTNNTINPLNPPKAAPVFLRKNWLEKFSCFSLIQILYLDLEKQRKLKNNYILLTINDLSIINVQPILVLQYNFYCVSSSINSV